MKPIQFIQHVQKHPVLFMFKNIALFIPVLWGLQGIAMLSEPVQASNMAVTAPIKQKELTIQEHVWKLLTEEGELSFNDAIDGMAVAKCESKFNPYAINVNKDGSLDLGLWQINEKYHPIDRACKFDVYCSTRFAIKKFKETKSWKLWICSR